RNDRRDRARRSVHPRLLRWNRALDRAAPPRAGPRSRVAGAARMSRAALAALVCACSVGPKYERPPLDVPAKYRFAGTQAQSLANATWWDLFRDPELRHLIREALEHNNDVRLAAARVEELRGQYGVARAARFPQVQLAADVARARASAEGTTAIP